MREDGIAADIVTYNSLIKVGNGPVLSYVFWWNCDG
jgi:hypothetical protein